jgi:outer membrane protein OmpA-like peptidoglycan-associated protein
MKPISIKSILVGTALLVFSTQINAQVDSVYKSYRGWSAWGIRIQNQSFGISESLPDTCNCQDSLNAFKRGNNGVLLSYYRSVSARVAFSLDLGFSYGKLSTDKTPSVFWKNGSMFSARTDLYYHLSKVERPLMAYLHTGLHGQFFESNPYISLPIGLGFRYNIKNSPIMFTGEFNYGVGLTNQLHNNTIAALGVYVRMFDKKKAPAQRRPRTQNNVAPAAAYPIAYQTPIGAPVSPAPQVVPGYPYAPVRTGYAPAPTPYPAIPMYGDYDGDGIADAIDKCPTVAGPIATGGCPISDIDGDGIVDEKDNCPTVAGPVSNGGCPVKNPSKVVKAKGCPDGDSDGDGIPDSMDKCPTVPGVPCYDGCPNAPVSAPAGNKVVYNMVPSDELQVNFKQGSSDLDPNAKVLLSQMASQIRNTPGTKYVVTGYSGTSRLEKQMSADQVSSIADQLIEKEGINPERLILKHGQTNSTSNSVKIRKAAEGEDATSSAEPIYKKK